MGKTGKEMKKVVNLLRLCRNCLSKCHQFSNCISEHNCRTCIKHHHSLLRHETKLLIDRKVVNNKQISNIPQKANKAYLQVTPVDVTMNDTFKH